MARIKPEDVPGMLSSLPEDVRLLLSGHIHAPWHVSAGGREAVNAGAVGMVEDNIGGGRVPFLILELEDAAFSWEICSTRYDVAALWQIFRESGAAEAAPEMTRCVYDVMRRGTDCLMLRFTWFSAALAREKGLPEGSREAWALADRQWQWPEDMDSRKYWRL